VRRLQHTRSRWLLVLKMSAIIDYLNSLPDDADEVDLSTFEHIEDFDDLTWTKLKSIETMKRVKLPPSLLTIKDRVFEDCTQLTEVILPSSLRRIEDYAFFDCSGLAMRDVKLPDGLEELGHSAFYECSGITGKLSTHITGYWSFAHCTGLTEVDLTNCKMIAASCFNNCTGLTVLELPSTLQKIGVRAFCNCSGLTGPLIIPPFVSFIGPNAFEGCTGMKGKGQAIKKHRKGFESWKARGNVLMTLIRFDEEYRRVVEENGGTLRGELSNSFLADYAEDAQLIYKATAHVDGTDNLANGICRLIMSFLPMVREHYGPRAI
jgi:hypothetical protein